jgi:hypothetical protein
MLVMMGVKTVPQGFDTRSVLCDTRTLKPACLIVR